MCSAAPDDQGGTVFQSSAYNVSTDTWSGGLAIVGAFAANGVGKIADRLYFSGGYNEVDTPLSFTNRLWAYDYANDQLTLRAPLPIFGAEGVSGVINGYLFVLPGACSGDLWPVDPRFCAEEPTRRLFRYNPATDMWVSKRQAPHVHRAGAGVVMSGKLYVVGGFDGFDPVAALDVYDPGTNSWRTLAPIPEPGRAIGAVLQGEVPRAGGDEALRLRPDDQPVAHTRVLAVRTRCAPQGAAERSGAPARGGSKPRPEHRHRQSERALHALRV